MVSGQEVYTSVAVPAAVAGGDPTVVGDFVTLGFAFGYLN